jgi:hypothetical protein
MVNGPALGNPSGMTVYAYLADASGKVALKTTVNPTTGVYSFSLAEINTQYKLVLSCSNVALGIDAPGSCAMATQWIGVGDAFGSNNAAGTGVESGSPDVAIAIKTLAANISNVDFGIQRLPNTDSYLRSINQPIVNQVITLNGVGTNPPVLTGTDPEDCPSGCVLTARNVVIDTVPTNAELYYNSLLVTNGQLISNFNPSQLQLKFTAATGGTSSVVFRYSYVDDAMMKDQSPGSYTLIWLIPLPADNLVATANLSGNAATIKWSTLSEHNTSYYIVERSLDNINFAATGNKVQAAGNSVSKTEYEMPDNIASLSQSTVIYYRVKLVDIDGKYSYSNIVPVRLLKKPGVSVWPNPFQSYITVGITVAKETRVTINLTDVNGRLVRSLVQQVPKGASQVSIRDLDRLPAGVYLVEITDQQAGTTFQKLVKNN